MMLDTMLFLTRTTYTDSLKYVCNCNYIICRPVLVTDAEHWNLSKKRERLTINEVSKYLRWNPELSFRGWYTNINGLLIQSFTS